MADCTDITAKSMRGTNPKNVVEKIVRCKIYHNTYWKEQCVGLTAETLVYNAMELDHLGGTCSCSREPTPFMCLVMKMLKIQPHKDMVVKFIRNEFKYVRVLGAFYLRLTGTDIDIYRHLEPLYNDHHKLKRKLPDGQFSLTHVNEVIDELLTKDYSCDIALTSIKKRSDLEAAGALQPRSVLKEKEENYQLDDEEEDRLHDKGYTNLASHVRRMIPQNLVLKFFQLKIYQSTYWREQCFGLTLITLIKKAKALRYLGGTFGSNHEATPFMCLVMKMLQIQLEKEIVIEFIKNDKYKYVRVLGAVYLRLTGTESDIYNYLEPLYSDYRKLRRKLPDGSFSLTHVDEVIEELLLEEYSCDFALPYIMKRRYLEAIGALEPRESVFKDFVEEQEEENDHLDDGVQDGASEKDSQHGRRLQRKEIEIQDITYIDKGLKNSESQNHRSEDKQQASGRRKVKEEGERELKRDSKGKEESDEGQA